MGRNPQFNREEILEKSTSVFRTTGFQNTTISDITKATGLKSGSIYSAFKNKSGLYTEVLDFYTNQQLDHLDTCVNDNDLFIEALRAYFQLIEKCINNNVSKHRCLLVNGLFELQEHEKELRFYVQLKLQTIEAEIYALLVKAQEKNELKDGEDPNKLSRYLMTLHFGHCVLVQLQTSSETLNQNIDKTFEVISTNNK